MKLLGYVIMKKSELDRLTDKIGELSVKLNGELLTNKRLRKELERRTDYVNNVQKILLGDDDAGTE